MKNGVSFVWYNACQKAFKDIKTYLIKPPVLASPFSKNRSSLCKIHGPFLSALLARKNNEGAEQAIYYLSRTLIGTESRYNPVKKECLTLVFAIQKMRHYLIG